MGDPSSTPRCDAKTRPEAQHFRPRRWQMEGGACGYFESAVGLPTEVVVPGGALSGRRFKTGRSSSEKESEEEPGSTLLPRWRVEAGVTVRAA